MDATTAIQSRAIGSRLVERNLLTDEQLEHALRVQEETGGWLGQIVLDEFGVTQFEFTSVLVEQDAELQGAKQKVDPAPKRPAQPIEQLTPKTVQIRRPIGEVFVELGLITSEELAAALELQRKTGARLGEVLIEQGYVTRLDLAGALATHWQPRESLSSEGEQAASNGGSPALLVDPGWSAEDHAAIAELAGRLSVAEKQLQAPPPDAPRRGVLRRSRDTGVSDLGARVDELALRVSGLGSVNSAIADLSASVEQIGAVRVSEALATGARLAGVESSISGLSGMEGRLQDAAERALAATAGEIADRLVELREELAFAAARLETVDPSERLLELALRIDRTARDGHDRIGGLADDLTLRLAEIRARIDGLVDRDEAVAASRADRADLEAHTAALELQLSTQRDETAALRARVEATGQASADVALWQERIEALIEQRLADVEMRVATESARARAGSDSAVASLRREVESLDARLNEMLALRHREAQAARIEREELGSEFEAIAASVGERLERIEDVLATAGTSELRAMVGELEGRIEAQTAIGEEQVRVTERALRKGLASLGEKLAGSAAKHSKSAKGAGRSIERLGAAVTEADARLADQIPASPLEGCVAFAPTQKGYRLVELPGAPPELGATIEIEDSENPLVVTRYGRSPLPFDGRPCVYLDRA